MKPENLIAVLCSQTMDVVSVHCASRFAEKAKAALINEKPHMSYRCLPLDKAIEEIAAVERAYLIGACT